MKNYVLYHASCRDGDGAALAAWSKLGDVNTTYIPVQYNRPLPEIDSGSDVFILDFSYSRQILEELRQRSHSILVLDHHKTAMEDLSDLPYATFDMNKSGARLAWEHFHPGKEIPDLILDIEDRDLWKFKRTSSKQVTSGLLLHRDFREYAPYLDDLSKAQSNGEIKLAYDEVELSNAHKKAIFGKWGTFKVAAINTTQLISETGEKFYSYPEIDFAMMYFITNEGKMVFSLRSNKTDVGTIAKAFGGGGHTASAGFTVTLEDGITILKDIIDSKSK